MWMTALLKPLFPLGTKSTVPTTTLPVTVNSSLNGKLTGNVGGGGGAARPACCETNTTPDADTSDAMAILQNRETRRSSRVVISDRVATPKLSEVADRFRAFIGRSCEPVEPAPNI